MQYTMRLASLRLRHLLALSVGVDNTPLEALSDLPQSKL
jgi:hypothetical protein